MTKLTYKPNSKGRRAKYAMVEATHKETGDKVRFVLTKDFLGGEQVMIKFEDGERTTISPARFKELFEEAPRG